MKYLGETLDIHGGGLDLQFPHHENELAQSESFTEKPFALAWMHNGLLKMGNAKMAGSVGNVVNVVDLLKQHSPETVRFLLLSTHYRSPIEWSDDRLAEVQRSLEGFYRFFERVQRITGSNFYDLEAPARHAPFDIESKAKFDHWGGGPDIPLEFTRITSDIPGGRHQLGGGGVYPAGYLLLHIVGVLRGEFLEQLNDDFNTGGAIGVLFELLSQVNRYVEDKKLEYPNPSRELVDAFRHAVVVVKELAQILGLFRAPAEQKKLGGDDKLVAGLMQLLIDVRNNLRAEAKKIAGKDDPVKKALFEQTDVIRKRLGEIGVTLEDRPGGTGWRVG
jgi:cysteinyl-tRNA synthetase